jgi:GAF domain-containing protein/ActR/RegA family two-component response regulator
VRLRSYLLVLIAGILLPVLLFSGVVLVLLNRQTRTATEKGLVETARALSLAVDRELTASASVLRALATADSLASGDLKAFDRQMRAVLASQPGWQNILLYDPSGQQLINTSRPFGEALPRTGNPELIARAVRERAPAISNLFRGSVLARPVVSVVVPVVAGDRVRYVLGMSFRPAVLSELLGAQGTPAGSIAALIDANGVFIARTREPSRSVGLSAAPDFVEKMRASPDTAFRSVAIEGEAIYAGVSRSAISAWTVEVASPAATVDGPLRASLWMLAGIDALCVVAALMVGVLVARRLRRSIHGLSRAARTFVDGQWVEVPASGVSEIDEVVRGMERADRERRQIEATTAATAAVGQELTKTLDPDQVTNQVVTSVYQLFDIPRVNLYRADEPARGLTCVASAGKGDPAEWLGAVLPWGMGTAGRAAVEERTISTRDLLRDPGITLPEWAGPRLQSDRFRGVTSIPLTAGGRVVGVLTLGYETERTLTPRELRALNMFADQAAIALRNSELFEHERAARTAAEASERRARLLTRLNQVISSTLDTDEGLAQITRAATELMDATFASFWVARENGEGFDVRGWSSDVAARDFPFRSVGAQGIVGWVATERRSVNVADVFADGRFVALDWMRAHDLRSFIGVPVIHDGVLLAVLGINGRAPFVLGLEAERLLEAFAVQAAIAIQNARFVRALRAHQGRLETLLQVGREIARIQPTTSLLISLAEAGSRLLETDAVGFRLVEGDQLVLVATSGGADRVMAPQPNPITEGLTGQVARTGEPLTVLDAAADPRCLPYGREAAARLGYRAWLGVPIKVGDRVTGVLSAWTRRSAGFSADDLTIVGALASQAAVALENDRLYQELERSYRELTQTQAQLMQSQKMEAIGQLAGGIAHDFNNLLTVITGRTIVALSESPPGSALHRHLELVRQSADRAAALTHQLLAYSRRQVLQPKVLDLNSVIAGVAPMLERLIGEDIELRIVRGEGLWPIRVDPGQIEQVIMNLSLNARDAMPVGGLLLIETANVELGQAPSTMSEPVAEGSYVMLKVEDSGVGMDEETQRRIFEPFFTTKEVGQGTGLGLATVQGVVSQHGGAVRVYSASAKGTTFKIYLPRAQGSVEASAGGDATRQAPRGKGTVLLVEDETEVRRLARQVMETAGYTVLEAHAGNEALALCQRSGGPIDLLLTDVIMPGMSGRELADRLTTMRPTMKVLFVSGYTDDRLGRHGVLEPGVDFLAKPFSPAELLQRIHEALGTR